MNNFLEIWFSGKQAEAFLKRMPPIDPEKKFVPHVTLVRPFDLKAPEDEETVQAKIVRVCERKRPIDFILQGKGSFGDVPYVPVISSRLVRFAGELESAIEPYVVFAEKLNDEPTLHVTADAWPEWKPYPRTEFHMTKLTAVRNKRILFTYDLEQRRLFNREESLLLK